VLMVPDLRGAGKEKRKDLIPPRIDVKRKRRKGKKGASGVTGSIAPSSINAGQPGRESEGRASSAPERTPKRKGEREKSDGGWPLVPEERGEGEANRCRRIVPYTSSGAKKKKKKKEEEEKVAVRGHAHTWRSCAAILAPERKGKRREAKGRSARSGLPSRCTEERGEEKGEEKKKGEREKKEGTQCRLAPVRGGPRCPLFVLGTGAAVGRGKGGGGIERSQHN